MLAVSDKRGNLWTVSSEWLRTVYAPTREDSEGADQRVLRTRTVEHVPAAVSYRTGNLSGCFSTPVDFRVHAPTIS